MKILLTRFGILTFAVYAQVGFGAAIVKVNMDSGSRTLVNASAVPLTNGSPTPANDGNGAVLQLGYYGSSTVGNNFLGTWTPITGAGGPNSAFSTTSIGDANANGAGSGTFAMNLVFDTLGTTSNVVPPVGQVLSLRIYDAISIAGASRFMSLSDDLWLWKPAGNPNDSTNIVNISLDDAGLKIQNASGTGSAIAPSGNISTNIPVVPEPTSAALLMLGLVSLAARRRRAAKV